MASSDRTIDLLYEHDMLLTLLRITRKYAAFVGLCAAEAALCFPFRNK